jgi:hypothetical protein
MPRKDSSSIRCTIASSSDSAHTRVESVLRCVAAVSSFGERCRLPQRVADFLVGYIGYQR